MPQVIFGVPSATSFGVDDVYVAVQQPQPIIGVSGISFQGGAPGCSGWGPKGAAMAASTPADLLRIWGPPIGSGFDLVQEGALFLKQLPRGGFIGVRVTDGTDLAATGTLVDTTSPTPVVGLTLTAFYTGSYGNTVRVILVPGSNDTSSAHTWKVVVQPANAITEIFDRIPSGSTPAGTWANIASAINNGQSASRPASGYIIATVGSSTVVPNNNQSIILTGGTDGAASISTSILIGVDGSVGSRTGLYALREMNLDAVWLAGCVDSASWSVIRDFARSELATAYASFPANSHVTDIIGAKLAAGIDDPYIVMATDFVTYTDTILNKLVSVPPACVVAGIACRMSSEQSPGNQPAYGIIGTEKTLSASPQKYSYADLSNLEAAGINMITLPIPSGNFLGLRHGKNSSSNFATSEIPYSRKTNDLVRAFGGPVMGQFVNKLQSTRPSDPLRDAVRTAFNSYLAPQKTNFIIDDFRVTCDLTNNPPTAIKSGILRADILVAYMSVVDKFVISLTAGQTVDVQSSGPTPVTP